jgi:predicted Fe-Mo cluster-binding NifX family protein
MKIAVPSENANGLASMRSGHFGHAPFMTIVELDEGMNIVSVESQANVEHGEGGCGNVIEHVIGLGVDGILAAGMGMPPLMRFTGAGMKVYFETTQPIVGDAVALLAQGKVRAMTPDDACHH